MNMNSMEVDQEVSNAGLPEIGADDYNVKLEVFEGPLDLLLYLIKKDEVDVYNIPIELITRQYMEYISLMRMLDLEFAGEFLVMAATLMMIKSRMLLPVEDRPDMDPEEEEDPRWDLIRQLVEYKKFKDAAGYLHDLRHRQENVFERGEEIIKPEPDKSNVLEEVSIFDLIAAFNDVLKKAEPLEIGEVYSDKFTVADKIEDILNRLEKNGKARFSDLFAAATGRSEIVCSFLALLELIRLSRIRAIQESVFGDIVIVEVSEQDVTYGRE